MRNRDHPWPVIAIDHGCDDYDARTWVVCSQTREWMRGATGGKQETEMMVEVSWILTLSAVNVMGF